MHVREDPRLLRFRDGFWVSRAIVTRVHADLEALRVTLAPDALHEVLRAITMAWQIVDAVHRVRELAQNTPGLRADDPPVRGFLDATTIAEDFRNYVQHLRTELAQRNVGPYPVWGSICWVDPADPTKLVAAFVGEMVPGGGLNIGVYDAQERRIVSRVSLSVKGTFFNVDPIVEETIRVCDHVLAFIARMQPDLPSPERTSWVSARFILTGDEGAEVFVPPP